MYLYFHIYDKQQNVALKNLFLKEILHVIKEFCFYYAPCHIQILQFLLALNE